MTLRQHLNTKLNSANTLPKEISEGMTMPKLVPKVTVFTYQVSGAEK